jgi:hypothetical protein
VRLSDAARFTIDGCAFTLVAATTLLRAGAHVSC